MQELVILDDTMDGEMGIKKAALWEGQLLAVWGLMSEAEKLLRAEVAQAHLTEMGSKTERGLEYLRPVLTGRSWVQV